MNTQLTTFQTTHNKYHDRFFKLSLEDRQTLSGCELFIATIKEYYKHHKRPFPWRDNDNVYHVFVSEVMLQQTQTHRVIDKYNQFIRAFPSFHELAAAPLVEVLRVWQGLGYNRRGKFLKQAAEKIVSEHNGVLPTDPAQLVLLPGIGPATAASVSTFAYNIPNVFIETNVRAVFIHFFFKDRNDIHDKELFPLIERTVDQAEPRQWYYALMDYGVMLKKQLVNPSRKSKHHARQSKFEGSDRQIRGAIIKALTISPTLDEQLLIDEVCLHPKIRAQPARVARILEDLLNEQMVTRIGDKITVQ